MSGFDVYHNLHNGLWSMRDRTTGRVVRHAPVVVSPLHTAFVVQPAGHRKALETKQKNVHAFVRGAWLTGYDDVAAWQRAADSLDLIPISYNPFRGPSFYRKDTGQDISEVAMIIMISTPTGGGYVGAVI